MPIHHSEILFIINPNSGMRRYRHFIRKLERIDGGIRWIVTRQNETARQVFEENIERFNVFVVVGGDGTVHEAARFLFNREDKYLAVVPNGSGNGFAYELGFNRNLDTLIRDIREGVTLRLDVIELNGSECINIAGQGFDSHVAHRFSKGKTRGFMTYLVLIVRALFSFRPFNATLQFGGETISGRYMMICFANNRQFGNYALIAPDARPNDGIFDIVLLKPLPFWAYPAFVARMFLGTLRDSRHVRYLRSDSQVSLSTDSDEFHIDGEPVRLESPVTVRMSGQFLNIIRTGRNRL